MRLSGSRRFTRHCGAVLVYYLVMMVALIGLVSLGVDVAMVQAAKTQAQNAADAAALYAAYGLIGGSSTSAANRAVTAAAANSINGAAAVVDPTTDVVFGIWDAQNKNFVVLGTGVQTGATAVQVTVRRATSRGTPIKLMFGSILGFNGIDIHATAIASLGKVQSNSVPGAACPWLAGVTSGSTVANTGGNPTPATIANESPVGFSATGGTTIRFANASGTTSWNPGAGTGQAGCDGDPTYIAAQDAANGINTTKAPLNALMGIFLTNDPPNWTSAASQLDFSSAASRDFSTLSPQLKQVFFIGDGLNSSGVLQTFNVPSGATRLFIGTMDEKGWWWDNVGTLQFTVVTGTTAVLVK